MYLILVKENGIHTLLGLADNLTEIKKIIKNNNLKDKIDTGKAYLIDGKIRLIRPETTPELLETKEVKKNKDIHY